MPLPSYILRRDGGRYHFQLRLSRALASCANQSHLRFSLRTTDGREARRRLVDNLGWAMEFRAAPDLERAGLALTRRLEALVAAGPPQDYRALEDRRMIEEVVASFIERSRERRFEWVARVPGLAHLFKVFTQQLVDAERGVWDRAAAQEAAPAVAPSLGDIAPPAGATLDDIKAMLQQLLDSGGVAPPGSSAKLAEDLTLSEAKTRFLDAEQVRRSNRKSDALCAPILDFQVGFLGDVRLSSVTPADLERLDAALPDIPHPKGFAPALRSSLYGRYLHAKEHGWDGLRRNARQTLDIRYQTQLRRFYAWLIESRLYGGPPPKFNGKSDEVFADMQRDRLVDDEVVRLVSASLFTGCDGPKRPWRKGKYLIQSDLYWIFLILLLTGMRTGEPPQIGLDDIVRVEDVDPVTGAPMVVYFFDMRPYDPAKGRVPIKDLKHLKRADFARVVPIHPLLIELGLLQRVARLRARGETRLFPRWSAHVSSAGEVRWGKRISRAFSYARGLPDIRLTRANICLYSTRHLMADWLDSRCAPQRVRNRVMGHLDTGGDESNAADAYGGKGMMPPEQAKILLELENPLIQRMREILVGALRAAERGELIRVEM